MTENRKQFAILAGIALAVVLFDLVSKQFATVLLVNGAASSSPSFLGFHFSLMWNEGAAGGVWLGDGTRLVNIASMSVAIALAAMVSRQLAVAHRLAPVALGLIIGAAAGNTVSLVMGPGVVDFIAVGAGASEVVFNVADIASAAGIAVLAPIAFSLAGRIRAAQRQRVALQQTVTMRARPKDAPRTSVVFEREVPIAFASEVAKPIVADDRAPSRESTIHIEPRTTQNDELRAP